MLFREGFRMTHRECPVIPQTGCSCQQWSYTDGASCPQRPLKADLGGGGREVGGWVPMSYHLLATLSPLEWLCIKVGSCVRHFNVSLCGQSHKTVSINHNFDEKGKPKRIKLRSFWFGTFVCLRFCIWILNSVHHVFAYMCMPASEGSQKTGRYGVGHC